MSSQQYADGGSRLQWPDGYERTPATDREAYPGNISLTHRKAFESIVEELERWGKTDVEIETAGTHYANDSNIPHKSADPDDVGVVAYYRDLEEHSSEQSAIACDRWESQRENARAISLWVRRVRLADRCGVETARDIDEVAQLPPADEEAIAAPPASSSDELDQEPHEILEISPDASDDVVTAVARRKASDVHPDGDDPDVEAYKRIQKAKRLLLR
ncbi:J domain-containing protein [Natronorubrum sp. JWXQ-INN-674]|uniref:J domain-containing protein n=1 Tax=Natronorubrum halalkaliphilum TaxID=2691917 RepID=A0A6B0VKI9_9EURY|nr:J domain-containing protein [Natronorubrum halalkaliphilum]MXV62090.1 J domain-containing protein [Natronorubrum halalkaliphilum]